MSDDAKARRKAFLDAIEKRIEEEMSAPLNEYIDDASARFLGHISGLYTQHFFENVMIESSIAAEAILDEILGIATDSELVKLKMDYLLTEDHKRGSQVRELRRQIFQTYGDALRNARIKDLEAVIAELKQRDTKDRDLMARMRKRLQELQGHANV